MILSATKQSSQPATFNTHLRTDMRHWFKIVVSLEMDYADIFSQIHKNVYKYWLKIAKDNGNGISTVHWTEDRLDSVRISSGSMCDWNALLNTMFPIMM